MYSIVLSFYGKKMNRLNNSDLFVLIQPVYNLDTIIVAYINYDP